MKSSLNANIIITAGTHDPFAKITKSMLDDPNLSWQAKGVLSYLLGKPKDWKPQVRDLVKRSKNGEASVRSVLAELRRLGYAKLNQLRDNRGRVSGWAWQISDSPLFLESSQAPDRGIPDVGNRDLTKNKLKKNELSEEDPRSQAPSEPATGGDSPRTFAPLWKPITGTKSQQLERIRPPEDFPSEEDFVDFLDFEGLVQITDKRSDLYEQLCVDKWHQWRNDRWRPIRDWQSYVIALNETMIEACKSLNSRRR